MSGPIPEAESGRAAAFVQVSAHILPAGHNGGHSRGALCPIPRHNGKDHR